MPKGKIQKRNSASASIVLDEPTSECGNCENAVEKDHKALKCQMCEKWLHTHCEDISDDIYDFLVSNTNEPTIHWFCRKCTVHVSKLLQSMKKVEERLDKVDSDLVSMKNELKECREDIKKVQVMASETDTKLETMIEAKLVESLEQTVDCKIDKKVKSMREDVNESMEIEKRKMNLVFHGIKESAQRDVSEGELDPDCAMLEEIFSSGLKMDIKRHIEDGTVSRIGKFTEGKTRPLRVKITSFASRSEILKRSMNLKDCKEFDRVFISHDLTRKQQQVDKDLRDRAKKFKEDGEVGVKIKSGKVVKNISGGKVVVLYQPPEQ